MPDSFDMQVLVKISKNGLPFRTDDGTSYGLKKEDLVDMERDLIAVRRKWEDVTGLGKTSK